ncbi:MAG: MBL fold metallo-hydrolase [Thermodesulfobacteriota bacterium]
MRFCVLGSGSKGNSTFIEAGNTRILIDAGFSGIEVERRLAAVDIDIATLSAILISHEHGDHIRGVGVLSRRFKLPVYASRAAVEASSGDSLSGVAGLCEITAGTAFEIGDLVVHPFSVSHDTVDPLGFVATSGDCSVGYCTDTGIASRLMQHRLGGCSGLVLECNHDPEMLRNGGYPPQLQQRIRGKEGHLTNLEAASFLAELIHEKLEHVVLAHLSDTNNTPELAWETVERHLAECGLPAEGRRHFGLSIASQEGPGEMICLSGG